jgi:arylsulfatase
MTNVVLLTVDSLRADHCSVYGYDRETTPQIDALAADGVRFENAYSPSSHTRESVPAILTGQYPHAAVDDGYHRAAPTLATLLADHHTGAFHSNPFVSRAYSFDSDFDAFDDDLYLSQHKLVALAQRLWDKIRGHHYARAETINERALSWLDSLPDREDFFVWNHYMDVHGPYEPPDPYRSEFVDREISNSDARDLYDRALADPESISDDEERLLGDLYDGEIRYNDAQIGQFLDALDTRGLLRDTVVIITSDHGDGLGDNGQYGHPRQLFDELVRVPMVASGIGASGHVSETPVSGIDVVPTALAGTDTAVDTLPGIPLQRVADGSHSDDRCVVLEARGEDEHSDIRRFRACNRSESLSFERSLSGTETPNDEGALGHCLCEHLSGQHRAAGGVSDDDEEAIADRLEALGYR